MGNWSLNSNWIGNVAPPAGGSTTTVLQFNSPFTGSLSTFNDRGDPFDLNGLIFNLGSSSFSFTSTSVSGSPLRFVNNGGTGPVITVTNFGGAYIGTNVQLAATLATNVGANGNLFLSGAVSGAGGLTLNGPGVVHLSGVNTYTGQTTINAGLLTVDDGAALGATSGVTIAGGTVTGPAVGLEAAYGTNATVDRAITSAGAGLFATLSGGTSFGNGSLTVTGAVGGAGGVFIRNNVTLSGTNTYLGPTRVGTGSPFDGTHTLTISSDASLGAGGTLELATGTVRLAGGWTTSRAITVTGSGTVDTNGYAATWSGVVTGTAGGFGSTGLTKAGAGSLTLTGASSLALPVVVSGGELRLAGNGALASSSYTLSPGTLLTLDNTGTNVGTRVADIASVVLNEGQFRFLGGSTAATETMGHLSTGQSVGGGMATVTLVPGTGQSATLTASGLTLFDALLVRGPGLGTTGGSRLLITSAPFLTGSGSAGTPQVGVLAGVIGDTSATGTGNTVVTYDSTLGVRPLTAGEYAGTITSGATTPANVRLAGPVTGIDAPTAITSLTLQGGGTAAGTGRLTVNANAVLATGAGTAVNVGTLAFGGGFGSISDVVLLGATAGADVTIGSPIEITGYSPRLTKFGDGLVTLNGAVTGQTFDGVPSPVTAVSVTGGTLRLGAAPTFPSAVVAVQPGATLDLNNNSKTFAGLSGAGTVQLGSGNLTLSPPDIDAGGGYVFGGAITGSGGLSVGVGLNLTAANPYTGPTAVTETGSLTLTGDGRLATNSLTVHGLLTLDNLSSANRSDRIGAGVPVQLTGGGLTLLGNRSVDTSQSVGGLTLGPGGNVVTVDAQTGRTATLTLGGLTRQPTATVDLDLAAFGSTGAARLVVTTAPALTGGILPYATANGSNLVTYEAATGVLRPLQSGETTPLAPGTSTAANAMVSSAVTMNAATQVNSLTLGFGIGSVGLTGTGTLTVTSGAVLAATNSTVGVPLAFGGAEGVVHTYAPFSISGPISGTGGLTLTGTGDLTLSGASTYTGQTTLNGGRVIVNADVRNGVAGPLGAGSDPVVINGTSLTSSFGFTSQPELVLGAGVTRFERPLVVSAGADPRVMTGRLSGPATPAGTLFTGGVTLNRGLVVAAPPEGGAGTGFTFDGVVSGVGRLELARGLTTLNGANTYSGGTVLGESFGSDPVAVAVGNNSALGTGPVTVRTFETTLRAVGGARTLNNPFDFDGWFGGTLTIDGANGLTLAGPVNVGSGLTVNVTNTGPTAFAGPVGNTPDAFGTLTKAGPGILTLTAANPLTLDVAVNAGTLRLSGGGTLTGVSGLYVEDGATLLLDNTAAGGNVSGRLGAGTFVSLSGGEVRLLGSSAGPSVDTVGSISPFAAPTLTVVAGAGREAILNVGSLGGSPVLVRGTNLGSAGSADVGRVVIGSPFLVGGFGSAGTPAVGVLSATVGDTSATGLGSTVVTHDATVGVRPLAAGEYAPTITPGATSLENVRLTASAAVGVDTRITSLTLGAGGGVTGAGPLRVASGVVVADGGTPTLGVASLVSEAGSFVFAATPGVTLTVGSTLTGSFGFADLTKFGAGTVILNGTLDPSTPFSRVDVAGGTLQLGADPAFPAATVSVKGGATLDLAGNSKSVAALTGNGTVRLGTGTLTVTGNGFFFGGSTFGGVIEGAGGGLTVAGGSLDLTGVNTYTGPTSVAQNAALTLRDGGALAGTSALNVSGTVNLDPTRRANSLGTAAVTLTGGTLVGDGGTESFGTLTVGAGANSLQLYPPAAVTASGLARADRGTMHVSGESNQPTLGAGSSLVLTAPPTLAGTGSVGTPTVGIAPFVTAQASFPPSFPGGIPVSGPSLVTYQAGVGLRPLAASEYAPLVSGQTTQNNALVQSSVMVGSNTSVQSLTLVSTGAPTSVTGTGTLTVSQGAVASTGAATLSAPLAFGGAEAVFHVGGSSFGFPGGNVLTVSGGLTGSNGLTLAGPGTLVLGGTANPGGPVTVNGGTLRANGTLTAGGTGVTVRRGATLAGTGTVGGPVTVERDAVLAPGSDGIGTLTVNGAVTILGAFRPEVSASPAASDRLAVTGTVTLGPTSVLDLTSFNTYNPTTTYSLITVTPGGLTGTFGSVSGFVPGEFNLVYTDHSVELVPVPEPGGVLLVCGAAAGLLTLRRRARRISEAAG